jgi:hypothetical protein
MCDYDHLSDFMIPDFRFGLFYHNSTWAFGSLYTRKKRLVLIFSLDYKCLYPVFYFLPIMVQQEHR